MNENSRSKAFEAEIKDQTESEIKYILKSESNKKNNFCSLNLLKEKEEKKSSKVNEIPHINKNTHETNEIDFKVNPYLNNENKNYDNCKSLQNPESEALELKSKRNKIGGNFTLGDMSEGATQKKFTEEQKYNSISEFHSKLYGEKSNIIHNNYIIGNHSQLKKDLELQIDDKPIKSPEDTVSNKMSIKQFIVESLDKNITALVMSIATIYALILSDLNIIFFTPDVDIVFSILSGLVFLLFILEFVLSSTLKKDYNGTFFFWLDLICILSMMLNIDWIIYPSLEFFYKLTTDDSSKSGFGLQKVMRNLSGALRLTRVTRLLRIIRIIRLIRLLKLYKNVKIAKRNKEIKKAKERMRLRKLEEMRMRSDLSDESFNYNEYGNEVSQTFNNIQNKSMFTNSISQSAIERKSFLSSSDKTKKKEELSDTPYEDILSESKISEKLSSSMTKLIITLIMLLLLTFPYLSYDLYSDSDLTNYSILLKYVQNYYNVYGGFTPEINFTFKNLLNKSMDEYYPIINITYNDTIIFENLDYKNYTFRFDELSYFYDESELTLITYSTIYDNKLNSSLNIFRTIYVAILLGWMIVKLDEDSKTHALYPLENIMNIIQTISRDPIGSRNTQKLNGKANKLSIGSRTLESDKNLDKDTLEQKTLLNKKERNKLRAKSNYEVKTIEAAVIKISALLAIGFGEAGEAIIKHNLKPGTQEVNPMVKGRKKIAIFGFCDIRQFLIVNECLQERTMSFVNQIANIVHTSVDFFMGAANKNIGDAFLCVWKFHNGRRKLGNIDEENKNEEEINISNRKKCEKINNYLNKSKSLKNNEHRCNSSENLPQIEEEQKNKSGENSENKIKHIDKITKFSSNKNISVNNNIFIKNENNSSNYTNTNNNNNTTTNNNFNYNININVLNNPNNNIKININNNNFINNSNIANQDQFHPTIQNNREIEVSKNNQNSINNSNNLFNNNLNKDTELEKLSNKNSNLINIPNLPKTFLTPKGENKGINKTEAADRALLGYLHIIMCINKKQNILVYRTDRDILKRIPNYKVKMGFGLHIGWAIEGAIGSHYKIDASYLSPNVNMSARLEAATKQYGVTILLSGDLYDSLSCEMKEICRLIDVVTVKGSVKPIKLYTVDLNLDLTPSEKDQPNINLSENRKLYEEKKERFYKNIEEYSSIGAYMKTKSSFQEMLQLNRPSNFKKIFAAALNNYIKGDWEKAKKYFNRALELDPNDGPSQTIYEYLFKFDFKAPTSWKGFRELSSK